MTAVPERTLDPQDWCAFQALGHRMVDDMLATFQGLGEAPAWQPMPEAAKARLREPLPQEEGDAATVYEAFKRDVLPYPNGNLHPRFWGWVQGTGTPLGMLADMLAAGMNPHLAGFEQSAVKVEEQVLDWLKELLGYPAQASGILTSGGSMANLLGLAVARQAKAPWDLREEGFQGPGRPRMLVYGSTETHSWAQKACELLGLGNRSLRRIPVDAEFRIDLPELAAAIGRDRAAGHLPFCILGTAGTVNTGAIDDLSALAALARQQGLWFHVDGAFGALAALSPAHRSLVAGLEQADSIAFDLHKWMYLPFEAGCVLMRDSEQHRATFALSPSYLSPSGRGVSASPLKFADLGYELTRGFKALKVWMAIKTHGAQLLGTLVAQNIAQAQYVQARVEADPELELLAPVPLNVVCFRYTAAGFSEAQLDALNQELVLRIQESGLAVASSTRIGGRFALRLAITNHRSRTEDFDRFLDATLALGRELSR